MRWGAEGWGLGASWSRAIFVLLWSVGAIVPVAFFWPLPSVPSFQEVQAAYRPSDVLLLDRTGAVMHEMRVDLVGRRFAWTPLSEISPAVLDVVVESEDQRFYRHAGVDWRAIAGVMLRYVSGGSLRGASTITMQTSSLLDSFLPFEKRGRRKVRGNLRDPRPKNFVSLLLYKWRQMRRAWALERSWSKAEILEAYLNLVPFRGELEGITVAAHLFFNKAPHGVTETEAIALAVMLRAPNAAPQTLLRRAWAFVVQNKRPLLRQDIVNAVEGTLHSSAYTSARTALAPHLARRLLSAAQLAPVSSSLDRQLQRFALESLRRHLLAVREQRVEDGAVLVVDNATGEILAYVGGSGDLSSARYVDGVVARRQAGSTLKPFLYGLALEQRLLTPASLLEDTPLNLAVSGGVYRPRDYDEQFKGLVSVRTALASSLNVPAVRVLTLVGEDVFVQQLRALGFQGLVENGDFYGPSLALGSADVSLWELVNAYRTLANGGEWGPLRMELERGERGKGRGKRQNATTARRLYSEAAAFLVSNILSDRESRSVTFGLENPLATPFWSAVKTGTSKDMRDNWCIGYSRRFTVGVWVGNFSGAPMKNVSGVTGAAPVWMEIMRWLHRDLPPEDPVAPSGVITQEVSFLYAVEPSRLEWFLRGSEPRASERQLAREQVRILAPTDGVIIALDPDIPAERQRVAFEASWSRASLCWLLDGAEIGKADGPLLWEPQPGRHVLMLVDEQQSRVSEVKFVVRGGRRR